MSIDWGQVITAEAKAAAMADRVRDAERAQARQYLADTDWYVIRDADTGQPVPEDVRTRRAEARDRLSAG